GAYKGTARARSGEVAAPPHAGRPPPRREPREQDAVGRLPAVRPGVRDQEEPAAGGRGHGGLRDRLPDRLARAQPQLVPARPLPDEVPRDVPERHRASSRPARTLCPRLGAPARGDALSVREGAAGAAAPTEP